MRTPGNPDRLVDEETGAGAIRTVSSRLVYENRWMRVREDQIARADGSTGIYGVIEKRDFVVVIPRLDDGFILVEQYRYALGCRTLEFPQGIAELLPDAPPDQAARAELSEETGFTAGSMRHLGRLFLASGYSAQGYDVFLADDLTPGPSALEIEEQDLVSKTIARDRLETMLVDGTIRDAATHAAYGLLRLHSER